MTDAKKWIPLFVLPFLLAVCFALWAASESLPTVSLQSEGDIWDLRTFDFSNRGVILKLTGPVAYIPNALLTPDEFAARADEIMYGHPEYNAQYATSRMRVLIPDGWYSFSCISTDFSERLYINGQLMLEIGIPGTSLETTLPDTKVKIMTLMPEDGVIEIVLQSSNFVHREGGGHSGWKVGKPDMLHNALRASFLTNIVIGCYLALFLVHMVLFIMLKSHRANLLFALICVTWLLRSGVTWTKVFSHLFPAMSWFVKFRIEYLSFPVTAVLFAGLIHTLFPGILQRWFRYTLNGIMALFTVIFIFADTVFMSWAILWIEGIFAAVIIYFIVRFAMKLRKVRPEQFVFLMGAALFLYASANDMLNHNNFTKFLFFPFINRDLSQISMLIFAFFAAAAIFIDTARGIEEAKAEEQRLAIRVQMTENQLALQREQYGRLMQDAETIKSIRHDFRQHLSALKGMSDNRNVDDIQKYLSDYFSTLPKVGEEVYCQNSAVNAIVGHYANRAASLSVKMTARINIPAEAGINDADLGVVFGNCLENAVEACEKLARGEGFITVKALLDGNTLSITIDNSFDGLIKKDGDLFLSGKREGAGIGIASVRAIAKKYYGGAMFEAKDKIFKASVVMMRPRRTTDII